MVKGTILELNDEENSWRVQDNRGGVFSPIEGLLIYAAERND